MFGYTWRIYIDNERSWYLGVVKAFIILCIRNGFFFIIDNNKQIVFIIIKFWPHCRC